MPLIKTTPMVRFALWFLRIYLLVLLFLIGLKFVRGFSSEKQAATPPSPPPATAPAQPAK